MKTLSISNLRKRLLALTIAIASLFFIILCRMFYVQVIWGEKLQEKAIDQWTRELPIIAKRGLILDRNGVVLADNSDTYTIFIRPRLIKDKESVARILANELSLNYDSVLQKINKKVSEVTIAKHIEKPLLERLLNENINGLYYSRDNTRIYPYGDFLSQILGFNSIDNVGQCGLESYYDKYLRGIDGEVLYETDIVGVEIEGSKPTYIPATDGMNIKLTIDYRIQQIVESVAEECFLEKEPKNVSIMVLDVQNGEVLAITTKPSYDLNNIPRDNIELLNKVNRSSLIVDIYEPGSTFKVLTASANVQERLNGNKNAFSIDHVYSSARYRYIDGQRVRCWSDHKNGKHANERLIDALDNSCNPIFVDIAMSLGKEKMYEYLSRFGYGQVTGIDFYGEASGMLIPKNYCQNVDLARIGFGQALACTGLQLACATASAVNGGVYYTPHLVKEISSSDGKIAEIINSSVKNRVISQESSKIITTMLESVVSNGSGKNAYIEGYRIGGKTGTAQKYENGVLANGKYVSSFVGFFPANNPKYLVLTVIDEPVGQYYGSIVAAPCAKKIFQGIIEYKNIKPNG